jgi:ATPase subunit of ABC transporter with duplicated ATPase domains
MAGYYSYVTEQALARQRREREAWEEQQREEQEERVRENAAARKRYLDGLAEQKAAAEQRRAAETEAALAPAKERARRDWLIAHPSQDAVAFENVAWPLVRENLLADEEARVLEATKARIRLDPRYSL